MQYEISSQLDIDILILIVFYKFLSLRVLLDEATLYLSDC